MSVNSITQGEQVAQLWPLIFNRCELEISFAHQTFSWGAKTPGQPRTRGNKATKKASVHVVILGLVNREHKPETVRLFRYQNEMGEPIETRLKQLTAYLFDASSVCNPHLVVSGSANALNGLPALVNGSQPIDDRGRNYTFNEAQRAEFLSQEPKAEGFLRPY